MVSLARMICLVISLQVLPLDLLNDNKGIEALRFRCLPDSPKPDSPKLGLGVGVFAIRQNARVRVSVSANRVSVNRD